jgi:hypothetical protein
MSGRIVKEKKKQEVWVCFYIDEEESSEVIIDRVFDSEKKAIDFVKANYSWEDYEGEEITNSKALSAIEKLVVE